MFFIMVTLFMLHSVTQTLATTNAPSGAPTQAPGTPTKAPGTPTQAPGTPTQAPGSPTFSPTSTGYCQAYSASNTNYGTQNYATCSITACSGDTVRMTTCSPGSLMQI